MSPSPFNYYFIVCFVVLFDHIFGFIREHHLELLVGVVYEKDNTIILYKRTAGESWKTAGQLYAPYVVRDVLEMKPSTVRRAFEATARPIPYSSSSTVSKAASPV